MRRLGLAAALALALFAPARAEGEAGDPLEHFPEGPNRELVAHFCSACHSGKIVANQAMSRERWDTALTWMTERHGMPPLEGEYREMFLDYLAAAFGEQAAAAHRSRPFATPPPRRNPFSAN
ncbi:MAG: hypothetical protein K6T74_15110 [Geminicoccaceae bacterium]|nr:hypothetical protein [Geminicoccaceae bacterium]